MVELSQHSRPTPQYHTRRSSSPSRSHSSSVCSRATSIDSLGELARIDLLRPIYHTSSGSIPVSAEHDQNNDQDQGLEEVMSRDWLEDEEARRAGESSKMAMEKSRGRPINGRSSSGAPDETDVKENAVKRRRFLKESNSRFVLFPIRYREVSYMPCCALWLC
jgi:ribonucleoside-diphosphate reductase subunit M2